MKIKISFSDPERIKASAVAALIQKTVSGVRRKDVNDNGKYRHIYITTKEIKNS